MSSPLQKALNYTFKPIYISLTPQNMNWIPSLNFLTPDGRNTEGSHADYFI
jgi:hypothetical protein